MIKEYAEEKIEENNNTKPTYASWAKEKTGTERYIAMWLARSTKMRSALDLRVLHNIFTAYGIVYSFDNRAKKAEDYFNSMGIACQDLDYPTLQELRLLGDKVSKAGLDPLLNALPISSIYSLNYLEEQNKIGDY